MRVPKLKLSDNYRNMFPENIIQATFQQVQTEYMPIKPSRVRNATSMNMTSEVLHKQTLTYTNEMNVLGLIKNS